MISVDTEEADGADPHVSKLAEEIMKLNLLQVADLTEILQSRLGIAPPAFGAMAGPAAGAAQPTAAVAPEAEKPPEKTDFDVKLTGFDAASKIRVIKEVRAMTDLGLKEAKELVGNCLQSPFSGNWQLQGPIFFFSVGGKGTCDNKARAEEGGGRGA